MKRRNVMWAPESVHREQEGERGEDKMKQGERRYSVKEEGRLLILSRRARERARRFLGQCAELMREVSQEGERGRAGGEQER